VGARADLDFKEKRKFRVVKTPVLKQVVNHLTKGKY
jgi:hypothetical protein